MLEEYLARGLMHFSSLSIIVPALLAWLRRKHGDREQRLLGKLIGFSILIEFLALLVGGAWLGLNNLFLLHLFTVVEFGVLAYLFAPYLSHYIRPRAFQGLIVGFAVFAVLNSIFIDGIMRFNAFARAIESVLVIALVLLYFYTLLRSLEIKHLDRSPLFWVGAGSLIYFSGSLFVFIYSNKILSSTSSSFTIWGIHAFLNILHNIFYAIALWVRPNK